MLGCTTDRVLPAVGAAPFRTCERRLGVMTLLARRDGGWGRGLRTTTSGGGAAKGSAPVPSSTTTRTAAPLTLAPTAGGVAAVPGPDTMGVSVGFCCGGGGTGLGGLVCDLSASPLPSGARGAATSAALALTGTGGRGLAGGGGGLGLLGSTVVGAGGGAVAGLGGIADGGVGAVGRVGGGVAVVDGGAFVVPAPEPLPLGADARLALGGGSGLVLTVGCDCRLKTAPPPLLVPDSRFVEVGVGGSPGFLVALLGGSGFLVVASSVGLLFLLGGGGFGGESADGGRGLPMPGRGGGGVAAAAGADACEVLGPLVVGWSTVGAASGVAVGFRGASSMMSRNDAGTIPRWPKQIPSYHSSLSL